MSKASLKKILKGMPAENIIEMVCELYDARKEAREYLNYWTDPDPDKALEDYKELVTKHFFLPSGGTRKSPSLTELNTLRKNFSTLVYDAEKETELYLHICDEEIRWILEREGRANSRIPRMLAHVEEAAGEVEVAGLEERFGLRIEKLRDLARHLANNPPEPRRRRRRWRW